MASCPKCNHRPLKKHPDGTRRCPRHGVVTPNTFLTVALACLALTGCAIRPSVVHNIARTSSGCYTLDGHPLRRADTGALWCDPS